VDPNVTDTGFGASQCEVPGEVPRFVGRAEGGGEHKPGVLPDFGGLGALSGLAVGAQLKRGDTDVGQRQDGLGAGCLGLAVEQLAA